MMAGGNLSLQGFATAVGGVFGWLAADGDPR
jgi:hypothetical protein